MYFKLFLFVIMSKNILFFSNYCEYSKEVLSKLKKNELLKNVIQVCIDNNDIQIPSFIQVVPTLYLTQEKNIVTDDDIDTWINETVKINNKDLDAYYSGNFSSNFSTLDNQDDASLSSNFTYLDQDISIKTNTEDSISNTKKDLGSIEQERLLDIKNIFKNN